MIKVYFYSPLTMECLIGVIFYLLSSEILDSFSHNCFFFVGSHGEASLSETEVPYVIWGSGVLKPKMVHNSHSPVSWNLNHLERVDVDQNDLAPLMSVLLGIPIPVNSLVRFFKSTISFSFRPHSEEYYAF